MRVCIYIYIYELSFLNGNEDGNGFITVSEFKQVMANLGERLTDSEVREIIKRADADGDGRINYDEFVKYGSC